MPYSIEEIKLIRKKLNLTQSDLAAAAGVSQSLIAKVESKKIDPTYSNAQKIFRAIDLLSNKSEKKLEDIMKRPIISISPEADFKNSIEKMKRFGISQLPVMKDHQCVGLVSESIILDAMIQNKPHQFVREIMQDPPPIISVKTSLEVVKGLLMHFSIVLVSDKGRVVGVITKADIISGLSS